MSGWKEWQIGEVVEASDFQTYVQNQVVQVYADSAARGSALGTAVAEGMVSYLSDTNATEVYNGSSWIAVGAGDITSVTAGTGLTGGGTSGDVTLNANYAAFGSALALTTGTAGFTALSNGTAGISYQPVSHNYIINGAFDIWQRGTALSPVPTTADLLADRWRNYFTTSTMAVSRQSFTPGAAPTTGYEYEFFKRIVVTSGTTAGSRVLFQNTLEDCRTLAGQTVTLSFFAKADAAKNVSLEYSQNFGTGGSSSVTTYFHKQAITTSWQRYSVTFDLPSVSGKTIGPNSSFLLNIWLDAGSDWNARTGSLGNQSGTFDFWGFQLEAGSIATPFKRNAPSLQGELAACQRYYVRKGFGSNYGHIADGFAVSTTQVRATVTTPTQLRVFPSSATIANLAAFDGTSVLSISTISLDAQTTVENSVRLVFNTTGATANRPYIIFNNNNTAGYLELNAEL